MGISRKVKDIVRANPTIYRVLFYIKSITTNFDGREHKKSYGELNHDNIIYVIRPRTNGVEGLMSLFNWVLQHMDYAIRNKYIPVVDMENYKTQYWDETINAWELFFTQPSNLSLEDAYKSKMVILSGYTLKDKLDTALLGNGIIYDIKSRLKYSDIYNSYFSVSEKCKGILNQELTNIPIGKCIGVFLRGTDYVKLRPVGEPIQPDANTVIDKVEEYRNKYGNIPVYLVTEDDGIYQSFKRRVPNLYIASFDSFISNYDGNDYLAFSGVLPQDRVTLGIQYLVKVQLLSMCRFFVGSIASGSKAALIMNGNKYESEYIFDLGFYK